MSVFGGVFGGGSGGGAGAGDLLVSDLLGAMHVLNNELSVSSGGVDEARALIALDMAQDYFESVAATTTSLFGSVGTLTTTANQEHTTWPSNLLRLDALWRLNNGRPVKKLDVIHEIGEHTHAGIWPLSLAATQPGAPLEYTANRSRFYWSPTPDATYTIRWYGLAGAAALTLRTQAFVYPDMVRNPLAAFAVRLLKMGLDDPTEEMQQLALELFTPVLKALQRYDRSRPQGRTYSRTHMT